MTCTIQREPVPEPVQGESPPATRRGVRDRALRRGSMTCSIRGAGSVSGQDGALPGIPGDLPCGSRAGYRFCAADISLTEGGLHRQATERFQMIGLFDEASRLSKLFQSVIDHRATISAASEERSAPRSSGMGRTSQYIRVMRNLSRTIKERTAALRGKMGAQCRCPGAR